MVGGRQRLQPIVRLGSQAHFFATIRAVNVTGAEGALTTECTPCPPGSFAARAGAAYSYAPVNANLRGPSRLTTTRTDLDATGAAQVKGNSVNKV